MAQTFKRLASRNVTTAVGIGGYTVAAGVTGTVIGLSVANTSNVAGTVDLYIGNVGNTIISYLVKGAPLPVAGTLVAVGGDQKVVLQYNDYIVAVVNGGATADALMSVLELS
jgi:hypothetical protein